SRCVKRARSGEKGVRTRKRPSRYFDQQRGDLPFRANYEMREEAFDSMYSLNVKAPRPSFSWRRIVPVSFTAQNSPSTEGALPFENCSPADRGWVYHPNPLPRTMTR